MADAAGSSAQTDVVRDFLACDDLEALDDRALKVSEALQSEATSNVVAEDIARVLAEADDDLGIANLMFHSSLLSPRERETELLRSLAGPASAYRTLAAAVGVAAVADHLDEDGRSRAVELLIQLALGAPLVTARRASASFARLVRPSDASRLMELLRVADEVIRRNVLVALLRIADPPELIDQLHGFGRAHAGDETRSFVEQSIEMLEPLGDDPSPAEILMSPLGVSSLVRIPSYAEWPPS